MTLVIETTGELVTTVTSAVLQTAAVLSRSVRSNPESIIHFVLYFTSVSPSTSTPTLQVQSEFGLPAGALVCVIVSSLCGGLFFAGGTFTSYNLVVNRSGWRYTGMASRPDKTEESSIRAYSEQGSKAAERLQGFCAAVVLAIIAALSVGFTTFYAYNATIINPVSPFVPKAGSYDPRNQRFVSCYDLSIAAVDVDSL